MINQAQVTPEVVGQLQKLKLAPNEGVMMVKFVLLTQPVLTSGEAQAKIDSAQPGFLMGNLDDMRSMLVNWLDEAIAAYKEMHK